jgi:hypothetical protein
MPTQPGLFDVPDEVEMPKRTRRRKPSPGFLAAEGGIATARVKLERPGGPEWLAQATDAIKHVAQAQDLLTADDVWAAMGPDEGGEEFRSQMGIAFRVAKRLGLIEFTGSFRASRRAPQHLKGIRVWRSLINAAVPSSAVVP